MKRKAKKLLKALLVIEALIGVVYLMISIYCFCVGHNVKEHIEDDVLTTIEYNGKTYHQMKSGARYILKTDEKIAQKPNILLPRTYYTLKNDPDNNFVYLSVFGDSRLFTSLSLSNSDDLKQGEITSVLVYQNGWNHKKELVDDSEIVEYAKHLKNYRIEENQEIIEIEAGNAESYSIYFAYDNLPVCANEHISLLCYNSEYYLVIDTMDHKWNTIRIDCDKLENICNAFPKTVE